MGYEKTCSIVPLYQTTIFAKTGCITRVLLERCAATLTVIISLLLITPPYYAGCLPVLETPNPPLLYET